MIEDVDSMPPFRVGGFLVDPQAREIRPLNGGPAIRVDPKPMAVLVTLAAAGGRPVSRDALFDRLWADTVVVEEALTRCISELRQALDDSPQSQLVIRTIRGYGYQLAVPVSKHSPPGHANVGAGSSARTPKALYVGVLAVFGVVLLFIAASSLGPAGGPPSAPEAAIRVSVQTGLASDPAVSPDSRSLVYEFTREGTTTDLLIQDSLDAPPRNLIGGLPPGQSRLSPAWLGTERVAYMLKTDSTCVVMLAEASTGTQAPIADCVGNYHGDLSASPNGDMISFSRLRDGGLPMELVLLDFQTGSLRAVAQVEEQFYGDHHPAFSPDSRQIAFVRTFSEAASDVLVADLASGKSRQVTKDGVRVLGVDWYSDDELVFSSNRSGGLQLWTLGVAGPAETTWLPTGTGDARQPTSVPGGGMLAFVADRSATALFRLTPEGPEAIVSNGAQNTSPALSPDGLHVAYVSNATGRPEIWISDLSGLNSRQATDMATWLDAPEWSPDGTRIAFMASPTGNMDIYVLSISSGHIDRVTHATDDEVMPHWSRDGSRLYYGLRDASGWEIWYLSTNEFRSPPVQTNLNGMVIQELADDSGFLLALPDERGLVRVSPSFESVGRTAENRAEGDWGSWKSTAAGLYYLSREAGSTELRLIDASGRDHDKGTLAKRSTLWIPWGMPSLDVSADGKTVVFSRQTTGQSDVYVMSSAGPTRAGRLASR